MRPSFDTLYRDHRARLVRSARDKRYFAFDRATAEDIVQAALLKAWKALPRAQFGPDGRGVTAWLDKIFNNAAKDYLRHKKRRPEIAFDTLCGADDPEGDREALGIAIAMSLEAKSSRPAAKLSPPDHCEWVPGMRVPVGFSVASSPLHEPSNIIDFKRAVAKLPNIQRAAVELKHAGYTYREIGVAQKCSEDAARDRVRRGRETLMECAA